MDGGTTAAAREKRTRGRPACWACGYRAPSRSHLHLYGWAARKTVVTGGDGVVEVYCPPCFGRWGWPPETRLDHCEAVGPAPDLDAPRAPRVCRVRLGGRR